MRALGIRTQAAPFITAVVGMALASTSAAQVIHHGCQAFEILQQSGEVVYDHMGQSIAVGGDFNGDGIKDIVMGGFDRLDDGYSSTEGNGNAVTRVFVFLGTGNSPTSGLPMFRHRLTFAGMGVNGSPPVPGHMDLFGYSVAFIRGVDVDPEHPCDSIVIGAPALNRAGDFESGRVWIFPGSSALDPSDTFDPDVILVGHSAAWPNVVRLDGLVDHGWFGASVATAQDSNGAFLNRLLVGAPGKGPVEQEDLTPGVVYDFEASTIEDAAEIASGASNVSIAVSTTSGTPGITGSLEAGYIATADLRVQGDELGDRFGNAVAFVGNVDGVSGQEFLVGAPQYASEVADSQTTGPGYVRLFTVSTSTPLITISGTQAPDANTSGEAFGFSVAGGVDLNGNDGGIPDLIVGAPLFNVTPGGMSPKKVHAGRVMAFAGGDAADNIPTPIFEDSEPNGTLLLGESGADQFGFSVAGVKNLTGDSVDDVLVGAWQQSKIDTRCAAGRLGLAGVVGLYSLGDSTPETAVVNFYGEKEKDHMGRTVAAGQLFGASANWEIVLSGLAFSHNVAESGRGYLWDGDSVLSPDPP